MIDNFLNEYITGERWFEFSDVIAESGWILKWDEHGNETHRSTFQRRVGLENIEKQKCVIFCKMDYVSEIFPLVMKSNYNHVLITSNCDFTLDDTFYSLKPTNIKAWLGSNVNMYRRDLIPIPLALQRVHGGGISFDMTVIDKQLQKEKNINNLVYMCHKINNNKSKREEITNVLTDKSYVTHKYGIPFTEYVEDIYNHHFVLAPEGNGIDCHRTWEALYLGSIPIVQRSYLTEYFSKILPMVIVDDPEDLTEEYLMKKLEYFKNQQYSFDVLKLSYWKNLILNIRDNI